MVDSVVENETKDDTEPKRSAEKEEEGASPSSPNKSQDESNDDAASPPQQEEPQQDDGANPADDPSSTMTTSTAKEPSDSNEPLKKGNEATTAVVSPENVVTKTMTTTGKDLNGKNKQDSENITSSDGNNENSNDKKRTGVSGEDTVLPPRPVKRARTAYFIFMEAKRPEIQSKHPGEGVAAHARLLGQLWSTLAPEDKEVYQQKAAEERERVSRELEEWKAAGGDDLIAKDGTANDSNSFSTRDPSSLIFPVARIRKITKLDPEVRGMSKEALLLITKCAELATTKLGKESVRVAQLQNRRKLLPEDVAQVCGTREQFLFLRDDVKDLVKEQKEQHIQNKNSSGATDGSSGGATNSSKATVAAAAGTKPLTSYFSSAK